MGAIARLTELSGAARFSLRCENEVEEDSHGSQSPTSVVWPKTTQHPLATSRPLSHSE